jgi:3-oxoacyl-[acyl-carrier-protein] synthase-1
MENTQNNIVITGFGMASSLGTAKTGCAFARAGLTMSQELDYLIEDPDTFEMMPLKGYPFFHYTYGFADLGRLVQLGHIAMLDLLDNSEIQKGDFSQSALFIDLSDGFYFDVFDKLKEEHGSEHSDEAPEQSALSFDDKKQLYRKKFVNKLLNSIGDNLKLHKSELSFSGKSGMANNIQKAVDLLSTGTVEYCILGGIDSLLDDDILKVCEALNIVKTPINANGFMPGEAAAFILLETQEHAHNRQAKVVATVKSSYELASPFRRFGNDNESENVKHSEILTELITHCLENANPDGVVMYADFSGENHRAKTWSYTYNRLQSLFNKHGLEKVIFPAAHLGEIGSAFAYVAVIMACTAF